MTLDIIWHIHSFILGDTINFDYHVIFILQLEFIFEFYNEMKSQSQLMSFGHHKVYVVCT